jgi:V/A-type H+-transporting ATPase subunit I
MAIVQMQKVAILAHSSLREDLLEFLHQEGVVQVSEATGSPKIDHTEVAYRAGEVQFAISVLKDVASKEAIAAAQKKADAKTIISTTKKTDVLGIVEQLRKLEESDTEAEKLLQETRALQTQLEGWKELSYDISVSGETETTVRMTGTLPAANLQILQEELKTHADKSIIEHIATEGGHASCVIQVWKDEQKKCEEIATRLGWTEVELPQLEGKPAELYEQARMQEKELLAKKKKNNVARSQLAVELPNLMKVATFITWLDEKQSVRESLAETESTFTLLGWMPKKRMQHLEAKMQKISPAIAMVKVKPEKGEEPPVLLKNPLPVTPFESVTNLYGLPLPSEMDPTSSLSLFFILYFALCLTDAGYGLVIALIFGIAIWMKKLSIQQARLAWLLFIGGIVTFFVSIPFGGWFGLTPEQVPAFLTKETASGLLFKGQVWNLNQEQGITFLQNLSLFLGITHLFFGMFLAGWHKWIHARKMEAIWVDFTSHLLLGAAIFYAVGPAEMADIRKYTLYGVLAIVIWGKGYGAKWFVRPLVGLIGLVNFGIGMISNSLSYLRILALGLVTGAIAAAVNQVAVEMGKLFPIWLGIPVVIGIFLMGHIVSIALNTLGSFIHSGRLQFIEFFSQFFEGGGREFKPFRRSIS